MSSAEKLAKTRASMAQQGIDAFIVPYADAFQSRNRAAEGADRLQWLTGFRGSAGTAVVAAKNAAVFVDSRYTLSARSQIDTKLFGIIDEAGGIKPQDWAKDKGIVGYDPFLHTAGDLGQYKKAGVTLKPVTQNPVDSAWGDKGIPQRGAIAHDVKYAGKPVAEKIDEITQIVRDAGYQAAAITRPDSVSWLLNVRVPALPVVPVVHGYVLLDAVNGHVTLFTDVDCSDPAITTQFANRVTVRPLAEVGQGLQALTQHLKNWSLDDFNTPVWFRENLEASGARVAHAMDPVTWPKACKNAVEQAGIRASHIRDGVALVRFMHHIDSHPGLSERDIEQLVLKTRARDESCFTCSFDPIVGFNENGAFVHGQVPDEQVKKVEGNGLLLIDSGGQYLDGTTDVTRTLAIGKPSAEMKRCFTLVMKGHIALASAVFPEGTPGVALDALARQYLWAAGLDYAHGTGHGVGYCLNVHEGPCNFSSKPLRASEPLKPGILMSNEPGYYREGGFGIRLENLCLVVSAGQSGFLQLETVTMAPFDTRALDLSLMTEAEKVWLNDYHATVRKILFPLLEPEIAAWLTDATAPV